MAGSNVSLSQPYLLHRCAGDVASLQLHRLLYARAVASLNDPWFVCVDQDTVLQDAGLDVAKTIYLPCTEMALLEKQVAWLGGFPVVGKVPGTQGGEGVRQFASLESLVEFIEFNERDVRLHSMFQHHRSLRCVVVDGEVVDFYVRAIRRWMISEPMARVAGLKRLISWTIRLGNQVLPQ